MIQIAKYVLIFLVAFLLFGCKEGTGTGNVHGFVSIKSCSLESDNFNLNVDFFAATYSDNTLLIRLQHTGDLQTFTDGLVLEIRDVKSVFENPGTPLEIRLEPSVEEFLETGLTGIGDNSHVPMTPHESPARATLYLNDTCPGNRLAFTDGAGVLTFDSIYYPNKKTLIEGSLDLTFIDPRSYEDGKVTDSASMSGTFRFHYDRNPQEQTFI